MLSPLLETSIDGATDAIINVTGGPNLTLFEVEEAVEAIRKSANTDINTIFGAVINENFTDELIVTVIATGFDQNKEKEEEDVIPIAGLDDEDTVIPAFLRKRGIVVTRRVNIFLIQITAITSMNTFCHSIMPSSS